MLPLATKQELNQKLTDMKELQRHKNEYFALKKDCAEEKEFFKRN